MSYSSYVESIRRKIKIVATVLFLVVIFCIIGEVGGRTAFAMTDDGTVEEKTTEEKEYYEYTDEELEALYSEEQANYEKEVQEQAEYEELVSEELKGMFVETEEGRYELQIPEDFETTLTEEQITELETNLNKTYEMLDNGEIAVDEETGEYYTPGEDDVFKLQARTNGFKTLTRRIIVGYKPVKCGWFCVRLEPIYLRIWYGIDIYMNKTTSAMIGILLTASGLIAGTYSANKIKNMFNAKFLEKTRIAFDRKLVNEFTLNHVLNFLSQSSVLYAFSGPILKEIDKSFMVNSEYKLLTFLKVLNLIAIVAQVFMAISILIESIIAVATGGISAIGSVIKNIAIAILSYFAVDIGIQLLVKGVINGGATLKLRTPLYYNVV